MPKVKVKSIPEKFRRAGVEFTKEPKEIDVNAKTLQALRVEPMLIVEEVEEVKEETGKGKK